MERRAVRLVVLASVTLLVIPVAADPADARAALQLPWPSDQQHRISSSANSYGDGSTHNGDDHYAIDFNLTTGDEVAAVAAGSVVTVGFSSGGYGHYVRIDHGAGFVSLYAHLSDPSVSQGAWVWPGRVIGLSGASGNTTGAHLHFVLYKNGNAYKPEPMSGVTGFGNYGQGSPDNVPSSPTASPYWYGVPSRADVTTFRDYGLGAARLHVWQASSSSLNYEGSAGWWSASSGYTLGRVDGRMVVGDFDGSDGRRDVATFYDQAPGAATLHTWLSTGSSYAYEGSLGWWQTLSGYTLDNVDDRMVAGDFNEDGRDDVAAMYAYSSGESRIHVWLSTGSSFTYQGPTGWWSSTGYSVVLDCNHC